jgi:hypothetical protein
MQLRSLWCAAGLICLSAFVTSEVASQDKEAARQPQPPGTDQPDDRPDSESLIDTWVSYAMPGEHHKLLERMAGKWDMAIKYRMSPDLPIVESEGTCTRRWILGKRFLLEEFDGGNLGLPFQGLAIYGYDSFEQKYTSVWVDTMSTAITTNLGACRETCDEIAFVGRHGDPWTGVKRHSRGVTRFVGDNEHVLELHEPDAQGREFKILEITYTRAKPEP